MKNFIKIFILNSLIVGHNFSTASDIDQEAMREMEKLRAVCQTTHIGPKKGRYYYMSDFEPYSSMFKDVPRCNQCQVVDEASRKLRDLEDKDIARRWQLREGGSIHTEHGLRHLTPEYTAFLKEIGAERYDGCSRTTTNYTGEADKSRYIGSPTQPDSHRVDEQLNVIGIERYWWEGTNDPLARMPEEAPLTQPFIDSILQSIKEEKYRDK